VVPDNNRGVARASLKNLRLSWLVVAMLSRQEAKTNHQAHSMVTLSSPRRLLLRPLFLRRLPLHHRLLRPALPERGHQQLPSDQRFLGRGILDVFCSLPNGTPRTLWHRTDNMSTSALRGGKLSCRF